jgi:hypothetical protein
MPHEVFTGNVTFSNNVLVAMAPAAGDPASFTVRKSESPKLLSAWASFVVATGLLRIRSTLFHDNTQGLREQIQAAASPIPKFTPGIYQPLQSQDGLIVEAQDADAAGNIEVAGLWIHYDNLPGSQGRFIDENALKTHAVQLFDDEVDLTPGVGGGYTGSKSVNGSFDLFKAETDYGLIGSLYSTVPNAGHIGFKGGDTGQLRCPIPALVGFDDMITRYYIWYGREFVLPLIPIMNAANKASTFVDSASSQAGTAYNVTLKMLQLTPEADKAGAVGTGPSSRAAPGTGQAGSPARGGGANIPIGGRVAPIRVA